MKNPQVISFEGPSADTVIAIWGGSVVDPVIKMPVTALPTVTVYVSLHDTSIGATGTVTTIAGVIMTYNATSKFWTIPISSIAGSLTDRHKYVARIYESPATNIQDVYLDEFAVDNNSFEETLMRLPFQVEIGSPSYIVWYDVIDPAPGTAKYRAKAYEGATGLVSATDASKVTHRGPIEAI